MTVTAGPPCGWLGEGQAISAEPYIRELFYRWSRRRCMVSESEHAPTFTATLANGDVEEFDLDEHIGEGPVVLAFFPGAFTPPCSNEMVALEGHLDEFEAAGATLLGVSADSAFSLNAFREAEGLSFDLVSDMGREVIQAYDLEIDIGELGLHGVANRAVFVVDDEGAVTYSWTTDDPTVEPDYDELLSQVEAA
jgi:peroxiredoxin